MKRRRKKRRSRALPLIAGGLALAAAMDVARRVYRYRHLFAPSLEPMKSWDPEDYGIPREAIEEHWLETPDGELLYAWYARAERPIASALFCHGNKGNLTVSADLIPHLLDASINVLFFDYRGFGRSTGRPSVDGVVADGVTAAQFHNRIRPKALPSILYGYSLGGAVAAQVIRRHPFDGLILQSTFTSLPAVTRALFPHIPLHLIAGNVFDTLSVVKRLQVPLLVMHGGADEVIPPSMAHELHDACAAKKLKHIVDGGQHKDLYLRDRESLVETLNRFATDLPRNTRYPLEKANRREEWIDAAFRYLRRTIRRRFVHEPL